MVVSGANIAGGNSAYGRVTDDYYATPPEAVRKLLAVHDFKQGGRILEPCVGAGHIANCLSDYGDVTALDIVDRGYPGTIIQDFLAWETDQRYDTIITNPPYMLAARFITKCMSLLSENGQLAMFLKIQFLEGANRRELFEMFPPRYVYVFRRRISAWNNGLSLNPATGRKWASTMTFAWYVWQNGSRAEPVIRWID